MLCFENRTATGFSVSKHNSTGCSGSRTELHQDALFREQNCNRMLCFKNRTATACSVWKHNCNGVLWFKNRTASGCSVSRTELQQDALFLRTELQQDALFGDITATGCSGSRTELQQDALFRNITATGCSGSRTELQQDALFREQNCNRMLFFENRTATEWSVSNREQRNRLGTVKRNNYMY